MSTQENVQIVKEFFAAMSRGDKQGLLALSADDIEWIIPGENWPLAGTHRGHAELAAVLRKASEDVEMTHPEPPELVAQGDRVLVVGVVTGKIKATNKPFKDDWVFDITVRNSKVTKIREYIDTQQWPGPPRRTRTRRPRSSTPELHNEPRKARDTVKEPWKAARTPYARRTPNRKQP